MVLARSVQGRKRTAVDIRGRAIAAFPYNFSYHHRRRCSNRDDLRRMRKDLVEGLLESQPAHWPHFPWGGGPCIGARGR